MHSTLSSTVLIMILAASTAAFGQIKIEPSFDDESMIKAVENASDDGVVSDYIDDRVDVEAVEDKADQADQDIFRKEAAALVKLPMLDVNGLKIGVIQNVVMRPNGANLIIVKLDSIIDGNRLLRAIPFGETALTGDASAVTLPTLTKSAVRRQTPFLYSDDMDTIAPVTRAADRAGQKTRS